MPALSGHPVIYWIPALRSAVPRLSGMIYNLLTNPNHAGDPGDVGQRIGQILEFIIEGFQFDFAGRLADQFFYHDFAFQCTNDDAVAAADSCARGNDQTVAAAIERLHRAAGNFQRIYAALERIEAGKLNMIPAIADRITGIVEIAFRAGLRIADHRYGRRIFGGDIVFAHQSHEFRNRGARRRENA